MGFESGLFDRVFYVRWDHGPRTRTDYENILQHLEAYRKSTGRLFFLYVVPGDTDVPSDAEQEIIDRFAKGVREHVEHGYIVVEGSGFKAASQRSRITNNWRRRNELGFSTLHTTIEEALKRLSADQGLDLGVLMSEARARGLLSPSEK